MATGVAPNTLQEFSQDIMQEFDNGIAAAQMSMTTKWFSDLTIPRSFNTQKALVPYTQPTSLARWHEVGTPIQSARGKFEYAEIDLEKISDGYSVSMLDWTNPVTQQMHMNAVNVKAQSLATREWYRLCEILENGDTDTQWTVQDGQQFFSNSHSLFGRAFDNLLTGNLSSANPQPYQDARNALRKIPWTNNEYLPVEGMKLWLVVPQDLDIEAKKLIRNTQVYQATINSENPYQGDAEVIVTSALQNPLDWYLLGTLGGDLRPFTSARHADYGNWTIVEKMDPRDENTLHQDEFIWYMKAIRSVVPTGYMFAIKIKGSS